MPRRGAPGSVLSAADVRRLDLNAEELGVPVERLMANAGAALAKAVRPHVRKGRPVAVLCGKGNNGGDGFAAAADLQAHGVDAWVVLAEPPARVASPAARAHLARVDPARVVRWTGRAKVPWDKAAVVVDCLLGVGARGAPRGAYAQMVRWANGRRQSATLLACDVPTGLGSELAVHPHETVTFHGSKAGLDATTGGKVRVAAIGIPAAAERHIGIGDLDRGYVRPAWDSHKGDNGLVLVVAGSDPLAGAPHYVAHAAARTGADLVHVAAPASIVAVLRAWGPDAIVHAANPGGHLTPKAVPGIRKLLARCGAVVVGPGLGPRADTRKAANQVLHAAADAGLPIVVDADGLDALDDGLLARHGMHMVLTPHAREFQDLAGRPATRSNVVAYAQAHGVTVLRKSSVDVVSDGRRTLECHRGHPTLTVGGTGDVLAGITATLLAKGAPPFEAACAGSYLVKSAGEVAAALRSYGASASDVADAIPSVLLRLP